MALSRYELIVQLAAACNHRARNLDIAEPARIQPGGEQRLVSLAVQYGELLDLHRGLRGNEVYFDSLSLLALALRDSIFLGRGPETARDFVLCMLNRDGFQVTQDEDLPDKLLRAINEGDDQELAGLLKAHVSQSQAEEPLETVSGF